MTRAELLALPPVIDVPTASRALGLGRTKGFDLIHRNAYPVRVIDYGRNSRYRVATEDILTFLHITRDTPERDTP